MKTTDVLNTDLFKSTRVCSFPRWSLKDQEHFVGVLIPKVVSEGPTANTLNK